MVGFVDTLILGRYAGTSALAGIGLGAVIYGIVYWGFGFLRMSTAGLTAQSDGAGDDTAVQAHIFRAVPLGLTIGASVLLLQALLIPLILGLYTASPGIEAEAATYLRARLWGLPATLGGIALMGWFVGLGQARAALWLQLALNLVNAVLSAFFVISLGWGLWGVGIASAIAEWAGFGVGLLLALRIIAKRGGRRPLPNLLDPTALKNLMGTNTNIFIRTAAMVIGFNFFANAAAGQGEVFLAGNHILMQFINIVALVLDSYAHTAEAAAGAAYGSRNRPRFDRAVRLTGEYSVLSALALTVALYLGGPYLIDLMTTEPDVRASAKAFLPYCALAPILGFAAWHLDGIFIGVTATAAMRNAGVISLLIYLGLHYALEPRLGAQGIWIAFLLYYVARGITLGVAYPRLRNKLTLTGHSVAVQG
jgi:MATE family multidrug resistance protein